MIAFGGFAESDRATGCCLSGERDLKSIDSREDRRSRLR